MVDGATVKSRPMLALLPTPSLPKSTGAGWTEKNGECPSLPVTGTVRSFKSPVSLFRCITSAAVSLSGFDGAQLTRTRLTSFLVAKVTGGAARSGPAPSSAKSAASAPVSS